MISVHISFYERTPGRNLFSRQERKLTSRRSCLPTLSCVRARTTSSQLSCLSHLISYDSNEIHFVLAKRISKLINFALILDVFAGRHLEGIWHTGIVAYGREYFFGPAGIQSVRPVSLRAKYGAKSFIKIILLLPKIFCVVNNWRDALNK